MKKGLLLILMFSGICFAASAQSTANNSTQVVSKGNVARGIFTIDNFDQERFDIIKPALEKTEGVTFVNVSPAYRQIVFVYDYNRTSAAKIQAVLVSLGQEASLTKTTEPSKSTK